MGYIKKPTLINQLARFDTTFNSQSDFHTVQKDLQFITAINPKKTIQKVTLAWNKEHETTVDSLLSDVGLSSDYVVVHPCIQMDV